MRRPTGAWTPAVHALLHHLERRQLRGAPRARGIDQQGRETLTYLPGEVVGSRRPWDLAFTAFAWVPLHARHVVTAEGFTAFADRPRRLEAFLDAYGWAGELSDFVEIVRERVHASADGIRRTAAAGDPPMSP